MKNLLITTITTFFVLFFVQNTAFAQQAKFISAAEFDDFSVYVMTVEDYPKDKMPEGVEEVYIWVQEDGAAAQLIFKLNNSYKIFPKEKSSFSYNWGKKIDATYENGFIHVLSGVSHRETMVTGIFKIAGSNKLVFISSEKTTCFAGGNVN